MRIAKLRIENFRSLETVDIELPQVCAFVGSNNAGKSNVLQAIKRALGREWSDSFSEDDVRNKDIDNDIRVIITLSEPVEYTKFGTTVQISELSFEYTKYKIAARKGERRLDARCIGPKGRDLFVPNKAPKRGERPSFAPLIGIPSEVRDAVPLIFIGTNRTLKDQLPNGRYSMLKTLLADVESDLHASTQTVSATDASGVTTTVHRVERFRSLLDEALKLLRTTEFEKLETAIKAKALQQLGLDPTDHEQLDLRFSPLTTEEFYRALSIGVREGEVTVDATELGEGIQNAIVIAILQAFEERRKSGAIIMIEEPEMFLHPQRQRSLYKTLLRIGERNQVIYTTHSPHFVAIPEYDRVFLVKKEAPGKSMVRKSSLISTPRLKEKLIKEMDPERSEMFFSSKVLFVEGDTEKLALRAYAERLGHDLDQAGATIVEVGGKRNLLDLAEIASSMGIPAGIVYDEDSSDFKDKRDQEGQFNATLDGFAKTDGSQRTWKLSKNYEDHLRQAIGESEYQRVCKDYPFGKPSRARLVAHEERSLPAPPPVEEILSWLSGKPLVDATDAEKSSAPSRSEPAA